MTAQAFQEPNSVILKNRVFVRPKGVFGTRGAANSGGLNRLASSKAHPAMCVKAAPGQSQWDYGFLSLPCSLGTKSFPMVGKSGL